MKKTILGMITLCATLSFISVANAATKEEVVVGGAVTGLAVEEGVPEDVHSGQDQD